MGSTQFGNFKNFCRDSTLPICNLFGNNEITKNRNLQPDFGGCSLTGIKLSGDRYLGNLGVIILCAIAILVSFYLLWRSERKQAAVGRREMQLFLFGYIVISLAEIFTQGEFPLNDKAKLAFTGIHLAAIVGTTWILMLNAVVGYQFIDDGTVKSLGLILVSALALAIGTGYIALDTAFAWTDQFQGPVDDTDHHRHIALYVLYQLAPLVFLFIFVVLEAILVLRVLGEKRPMLYLGAAVILFAIGQIFQYVISTHICHGANGKIDGSLFETLFTLLAVVAVWYFWSSITEDDWPTPTGYP